MTGESIKIVYTGEIIDFKGFDRILAIMVADGKMYVSGCDHQDCFQNYCNEKKIDSGICWEDGMIEDHDKAAEITNSLFQDEKREIYGFDVFVGDENQYYLTSHFPHNMEKCYSMMRSYAKENDCIMGTFYIEGRKDWNVKIIDETETDLCVSDGRNEREIEEEIEI